MNTNLRPPAAPLITVDPFFSIWSFNDKLTDDHTYHWTGQRNAMSGNMKVDGRWYRFMGKVSLNEFRHYHDLCVMEQTSLAVRPTTTIYTFEADEISLTLKFFTPLLMDDLYLMTRPVSYISYEITAKDNKAHDIEMYFDISAEAAVNTPDRTVRVSRTDFSIKCGRGDKNVLNACGDDIRIDWGYLHIFGESCTYHAFNYDAKNNYLSGWEYDDEPENENLTVSDNLTVLSLIREHKLTAGSAVSDFLCIGYDDIHSIQYMGKNIDAYYKKDGATFGDAAKAALSDYAEILARCEKFDDELVERARKISDKYADIVSLAYRQAIAAHKCVWDGEKMLFLSKECFSNGCLGTVDVTYPSIPLFLIYNPDLVCGMLDGVFEYASSELWSFDFAPHDIGRYPFANGQEYCYNSTLRRFDPKWQMPVEECGNMLLCTAAVCRKKGSADYAKKNMSLLSMWADYLTEHGYDSENELCTDDFAGHLSHNCNLSVKAILGIAAWSMLLDMMGESEAAAKYLRIAKELAAKWKNDAFDGDHYRLAFDKEDTWSLKYNLVWDQLLGLNIFDSSIAKAEAGYYLTKLNPCGVPLDSRSDYTKSDWLMWSTLLGGEEYLNAAVDSLWNMLNTTRHRVPFTDWYYSTSGDLRGFRNRTVQGGLFINMLEI